MCADYGKLSLGKSVCLTFTELSDTNLYFYCPQCRISLLSKKDCPVAHEFVHVLPKGGFVCNICCQS